MVNIVKAFRRSVRSAISRSYNWFVKVIIRLGSERKIWDGIYSSRDEIPIGSRDWDYFTNWQFNEVKKLAGRENDDPDEFFTGDRALFPLLISVMQQNTQEITVLDIGGGVGIDFFSILNCTKNVSKLNYYVVEIPEILQKVDSVFKAYPQIHYIAPSDENSIEPDVILFNSSLQYIDNFKERLSQCATKGAKFIVFIRLSAGHFNAYLTNQINIPDIQTPYWFVNIEEIINLLYGSGYELLYQSRGDCEYYQGNFPEYYRMGRTWNLIFCKKELP
jgi:putative methyltransferase (TIGR04325 family)